MCVEGAAGLQSPQQMAGIGGDGGGASLFLQSGFPQSSGYTSSSPTALPEIAPGSPWALEVMCKNAHTEGRSCHLLCVSTPGQSPVLQQWVEKCLCGAWKTLNPVGGSL